MSAPSVPVTPTVPDRPGAVGRLRVVRSLGDLVGRHRRRRGLTQQELADFSTVSIRAIRDLEHGVTLTPRPDTVRLLSETLRLSRPEREEFEDLAGVHRPDGATVATARTTTAGPGAVRAERVVGREGELAAIRAWSGDPDRNRPPVLTVLGLPGVGKTALVRAVAVDRAAAGVRVVGPAQGGRRDPAARLAHAAVAELTADHGRDPASGSSGHAVRWAERIGVLPTLVVLDDPPCAPHPELMDRMIAAAPGLRIVVGTDRPDRAAGECLPVAGLAIDRHGAGRVDAFALLRSPGGGGGVSPAAQVLTGPCGTWTSAEVDDLEGIARTVGGVPALLRALGPLIELYGPRTVRSALEDDLLGTLRSGAGDHPGSVVHRTALVIDGVPATSRDLLDRWAGRPTAAEVTVAEIAALTGLDLWECGRRFEELRRAALLWRVGPGRFRLPALVRALVLESTRVCDPTTATTIRPEGRPR